MVIDIDIIFRLVGAIVILMLFLFMNNTGNNLGGAGGFGGFGGFNNNNPIRTKENENVKGVIIVCALVIFTLGFYSLIACYFNANAPIETPPPIGLDANILRFFLDNYLEFENFFSFLSDKNVTLIQKQQRFNDFEVFLNQCENLVGKERKFAIFSLSEILRIEYATFEDFRFHGELTLRFSRSR